jgi:hypothetical protein
MRELGNLDSTMVKVQSFILKVGVMKVSGSVENGQVMEHLSTTANGATTDGQAPLLMTLRTGRAP